MHHASGPGHFRALFVTTVRGLIRRPRRRAATGQRVTMDDRARAYATEHRSQRGLRRPGSSRSLHRRRPICRPTMRRCSSVFPGGDTPQLRQLKALQAAAAQSPKRSRARDGARNRLHSRVPRRGRSEVPGLRAGGTRPVVEGSRAADARAGSARDDPAKQPSVRAGDRRSRSRAGARTEHAQALLTRATVLTVQGRYRDARDDCNRLAGIAPEIYRVVCIAAIDSVTGNAGTRVRSACAGRCAAPRASTAQDAPGARRCWARSPTAVATPRPSAISARRSPASATSTARRLQRLAARPRPAEVVALLRQRDARRSAAAAPRPRAAGAEAARGHRIDRDAARALRRKPRAWRHRRTSAKTRASSSRCAATPKRADAGARQLESAARAGRPSHPRRSRCGRRRRRGARHRQAMAG